MLPCYKLHSSVLFFLLQSFLSIEQDIRHTSGQPRALGSGCAPGFGGEGGDLLGDGAGSEAQACPSEARTGEGCLSQAVRSQRAGPSLDSRAQQRGVDEGCCRCKISPIRAGWAKTDREMYESTPAILMSLVPPINILWASFPNSKASQGQSILLASAFRRRMGWGS